MKSSVLFIKTYKIDSCSDLLGTWILYKPLVTIKIIMKKLHFFIFLTPLHRCILIKTSNKQHANKECLPELLLEDQYMAQHQ